MTKQKITLYSKGDPKEIEVETGSTIGEMLADHVKGAETLVKNVSSYKGQEYLPLETRISKAHTMLYIGKDPHDID